MFLGLGGMVNVWLPPDPKTAPPPLPIDEKVRKNPAFAGMVRLQIPFNLTFKIFVGPVFLAASMAVEYRQRLTVSSLLRPQKDG